MSLRMSTRCYVQGRGSATNTYKLRESSLFASIILLGGERQALWRDNLSVSVIAGVGAFHSRFCETLG